jgi:ribosome recycling factor
MAADRSVIAHAKSPGIAPLYLRFLHGSDEKTSRPAAIPHLISTSLAIIRYGGINMDAIETAKEKMAKTIAVLHRDLSSLRAGRANAQVLDRIMVDYYGTPTPVNQVGNISSPEARMLVITPYDPSVLNPLEKAIQKSDLGINPSNDGKCIRLIFPELTEERRKELAKTIQKKGEESKVAIRSIRRDAIEQIKKAQKDSEITEDDRKKLEDQAQKLTDSHIKDIDKIVSDKQKEIMEV